MFGRARIKLTAWYTLIIMIISGSFSLVVYRVLDQEINRFARVQRVRIERSLFGPVVVPFRPPEPDPDLLSEARQRIVLALGLVNIGILLLATGFGFILAGRTLQPIKEMVEEQNRFVGDASHELRTPLTSLKSAIEVYLREKKTTIAESKRLARESLTEINKMQSLSDAMLQLAQFQKPNRKMYLQKIKLAEIINKAVSKMEPLAKSKNIRIETSIGEMTVWGDEYELPDLFVILLDNAIKYSHKGGKIYITATKHDGTVRTEVRDEGIGIEEKDMGHIFERFYRADSARTKSDTGGYGLGLAIAKKIAEDHHGGIDVISKPGKGTTFLINLHSKQPSKVAFS